MQNLTTVNKDISDSFVHVNTKIHSHYAICQNNGYIAGAVGIGVDAQGLRYSYLCKPNGKVDKHSIKYL